MGFPNPRYRWAHQEGIVFLHLSFIFFICKLSTSESSSHYINFIFYLRLAKTVSIRVRRWSMSPSIQGLISFLQMLPRTCQYRGCLQQKSQKSGWNRRDKTYFESLFVFAAYHLTDVGAILLMHPKCRRIERTLDSESHTYSFRLVRDWWGYNPLPMASTVPKPIEVRIRFWFPISQFMIIVIYASMLTCEYLCFADSLLSYQSVCS